MTNNDPVPKPEADTADRLQMALPPQQPPAPQGAPMMHPSAAAPSVPLLSTPSPRAQASPFFKPDPDGEGLSGALLCMAASPDCVLHPSGPTPGAYVHARVLLRVSTLFCQLSVHQSFPL